MAMLNPYQQYANNQVNTAPPEELTLMLYKGAVRFINQASKALDSGDLATTNTNIIKAQNIYYELVNTLDRNYAISNNLASLYDYIISVLVQANIKKDQGLLEEAANLAKEFVTTWEEAIKIYRRSNANGDWVK